MLERIDGRFEDEELVQAANGALESGDFSAFGGVPLEAIPLAVIALDFIDGRVNYSGPQVKRFLFEGEKFLALKCEAGLFRLHSAVIA